LLALFLQDRFSSGHILRGLSLHGHIAHHEIVFFPIRMFCALSHRSDFHIPALCAVPFHGLDRGEMNYVAAYHHAEHRGFADGYSLPELRINA